MKYPKDQYEVLVECLKVFHVHMVDIKELNPNTLHYMVYQQFSEGQKHNWLYCVPGGILKRQHQLTEEEAKTSVKFLDFPIEKPFELYPEGCNDNHIPTAVKKAISEVFNTEYCKP
jgi:hypothetical protein